MLEPCRPTVLHSGDNLRTPSLLDALSIFTLAQFYWEGCGNLGLLAGSGADFYLHSGAGLKCGLPGGSRFFSPIPSRCWRSRNGRFEVGGAARCAGASGPLECWPARVLQSRSVCLGALRSPICLLGRAPCGVLLALLKAARVQPAPLLIPANSGGPTRVGDKPFRTRPFSRVHTLMNSLRWVKNRFRQTAEIQIKDLKAPNLMSSFSTPWISVLSAVARCFYKLRGLLLLFITSTVEKAPFIRCWGLQVWGH